MIQGSGVRGNVGTYKTESLPNITGAVYSILGQRVMAWGGASGWYSGALYGSRKANPSANGQYPSSSTYESTANDGIAIDASLSSSTYQNNASVQPNALLIQCCIKY